MTTPTVYVAEPFYLRCYCHPARFYGAVRTCRKCRSSISPRRLGLPLRGLANDLE